MGTPDFAVPSLEILVQHHYPILAVVTAPDKPRGRGQKVAPTAVKQAALRFGLPVIEAHSVKDPDFIRRIADLHPDLLVVVAFRILPKEVLALPRLGSINLHASLLPKYRGAAPINWAIIKGEQETGVTTFLLQERVDAGNILLQARVPILPEDDAGTLHDKLAAVGAEVLLHTIRLMEMNKITPQPQDDSLATPAPKIFKEDCRIDWRQPAQQIHNRVRGLSPSPAAFTTHNDRIIKIFRTTVTERASHDEPGTVIIEGRQLFVATADSLLRIEELQQEGHKRMKAEEFLRGYRLNTGEVFR
ncbi:MAG TPA: methionyl-tRNA formyltransferase [Bacteroidota bacterium]|nr:methionyl-tRNA formyltransferase [Bacteroidota bacterium]